MEGLCGKILMSKTNKQKPKTQRALQLKTVRQSNKQKL